MPVPIRLRAYKLFDPQQQSAFATDFAMPFSISQALWPRFISDIASLQAAKTMPEYASELGINAGEQSLQVQRKGETVKVEPQPKEEITNVASLLLPPDPNKEDLLKVLPQMLAAYRAAGDSTDNSANKEVKQLEQEIIDLAGDDGKELIAVNRQIDQLEAKLAKQREIDEVELGTAQVNEHLEMIETKLGSVDQLAKRQKQIESILSKYGQLLQADLEQEGAKLSTEITSLRQKQLVDVTSHKLESVIIPKDEEEKQPKFLIKEILAFAGVTLLIGLAGILLLHDLRILGIGIVFTICELVLLAVINIVPAGISRDLPATAGTADTSAPKMNDSRIQAMERFFVDKAWVNALRSELGNQKQAMSDKLSGFDYDRLTQLRELVRNEFQAIRLEVDSYKGQEIAPDIYLQKRRELDSFKVKRTKLENTLSSEAYYEELQSLLEEWQDLGDSGTTQSDLNQVNDTYFDFVSNDSKLQAIRNPGDQPADLELTREELMALYAWMTLHAWESSPLKPLIVVTNALNLLGQRAQTAINAKIGELQNKGQIITVTVQG